MRSTRRRNLVADRKLQGTLITHTVIYWFYCLFSVTMIAVCWIFFTHKPTSSAELFGKLWLNCGPALLGSILLLPLVLMDCLRLSNRFAGPMLRVRRTVEELAEGRQPAEIHLREGDFFKDCTDNLNRVIGIMTEAGLCQPISGQPAVGQHAAAEVSARPTPAVGGQAALDETRREGGAPSNLPA